MLLLAENVGCGVDVGRGKSSLREWRQRGKEFLYLNWFSVRHKSMSRMIESSFLLYSCQ